MLNRAASLILLSACLAAGHLCAQPAAPAAEKLGPGLHTLSVPAEKQTGKISHGIPVDVFIPAGNGRHGGDVLVLPGWNFPRTEWQRKTDLLVIARDKRLRLIFPEMGKSLYESRYFPETRLKWAATPGGVWVKELLIPELQRYGLLVAGGRNFLLGLSTGGRGVALVHLSNPGLFKAGAALSGDFDQTAMPSDRLMSSVYGPYSSFKERWSGIDNPMKMIGSWSMPLYLGHGKRDVVVPFSQTDSFHRALREAHPKLRLIFNAPERAGHDFAYWGSELRPVIDFFLSIE